MEGMSLIHLNNIDREVLPFVEVTEPIWKVWRLMNSGTMNVVGVTKRGQILGVLRLQDLQLFNQVNNHKFSLFDVVQKNFLVVGVDDSFEKVVNRVLREQSEYVVVGDGNNKFFGILTLKDLLKASVKSKEMVTEFIGKLL